MRTVKKFKKFDKDVKRCLKRGYSLNKLMEVVDLAVADKLDKIKHRPHLLSGDYAGYWECHISSDWIMIYQLPNDEEIIFYRTGTHSDLFR